MPSPLDEFDAAFRNAVDNAEAKREEFARGQPSEVYAALFQTDLGLLILEDLYKEFTAVTRWSPGEGVEFGYFREGQSNVVEFILHKLAAHHADSQQGEANG